jgi:hypothetical protein
MFMASGMGRFSCFRLSRDRRSSLRLWAGLMVTNSLRALWNAARPAQPPARVCRDWALLGVAVSASLIEAALRPNRTWLLVTLVVSIVVAPSLLWRRTRPLAAVAVAFGTLIVFDVARKRCDRTAEHRGSARAALRAAALGVGP